MATRKEIDFAKKKLPLPDLMAYLGDEESAKRSAKCPFHEDHNPSFSVSQTPQGTWLWNCFAGCGGGDEIAYLQLKESLSIAEAIEEFVRLADEEVDTEIDQNGQDSEEAETKDEWQNYDY